MAFRVDNVDDLSIDGEQTDLDQDIHINPTHSRSLASNPAWHCAQQREFTIS